MKVATIGFLMIFALVFTGCNHQHADDMERSKHTGKKSNLKLIVVFKKNISIRKAKTEIREDRMKVINIFQSISNSSGQPTLLIASKLGKDQTNNLLKKNRDISSFTYEETIVIEPDPNRPQ